MSSILNIEELKKINDDLILIRRYLHAHAEISNNESQTEKYILEELGKLGIEIVQKDIGGHGVVAIIRGNTPGKTVALRADMDALQIEETTGVDYCSQHKGVMHACGHDNHMTFLLGAAKVLIANRDKIKGNVKLVFQPAEELSPTGGSRNIMSSGALDDVDAIFGIHVWPDIPNGKVVIKYGAMMAASDHFYVTFDGKPSHAAQPDKGVDAIVMGARFVDAVQTIISRETNPLRAAVITIGLFNAGTRYNIVAGQCKIEGTCRTFDPEVRDHIEKRLQEIADGICMTCRGTATVDYQRGYMSLVNDDAMTEKIEKAALNLFGEDNVFRAKDPSTGGEDFAFYLKEIPGAFVWLGTGTPELNYPLHNSKFNIDESVLWRGAALFAETALEFLSE